MKPKTSLRYLLALSGSSLLLASQAFAQGPYYWDNNGDTAGFGTASGTWSATASLFSNSATGVVTPTGTVAPVAGTDSVNFGANTLDNALGSGAITVDGNVGAGSMYFEPVPSGTITFNAINGGKITTGNNRVESYETGTSVIFNADFVGATTQFFGNGSTTVFNGTYKNTGNTSVRTGHSLHFGSTATLDIANGRGIAFVGTEANGTIRYSSNNDGGFNGAINGGSATNKVIKDGSATSTLTLAGTNPHIGQYRIEAGTLKFATRAGLYSGTDTNWLASNIIVGNTGILGINVGGTNRFTIADVGTLLTNLGGANGTSTTGFAAGSAIAIDTTNAGGNQTLSALIADSTGTGGGSFGLTKLGANTLILDNANTYSGATKVNGGTLALGSLASINNSANISIAAGATLDVSQQASPFTLSASNTLSASGTGTTAGTTAARIIGPSGGVVSFASRPITLTWSGDTSGTDTDSPALVVSQGELTLDNNVFTINGPTLDEGTYRLVQVGDGITGTLNENGTPSYAVSGTAINVTKTNVISSDDSGSLILTVTPGSGSPYSTWASTNAPGGNPDEDYDGDGVTNAVEFVLGGDKDTNDLGKLPVAAASGTDMTFTFTRDETSVDPGSVAVSIEVSTDLVNWDAGSSPYTVPDTATAGPPVEVVDNGDTHAVTLTVTKEPDSKKFVRLKVEITP